MALPSFIITPEDNLKITINIPKQLRENFSAYNTTELSVYMQETRECSPDYNQLLVIGGNSLLKKKTEYFVHCTPLLKFIRFSQIVEKEFRFFSRFIARYTLLNIINSFLENEVSVCLQLVHELTLPDLRCKELDTTNSGRNKGVSRRDNGYRKRLLLGPLRHAQNAEG